MRILLVAVVILGLIAPAVTMPAPAAQSGPTTAVDAGESPWWTSWSRDRSGNRIDDAIDALEQGVGSLRGADGVPRYAVQETPDGLRYNAFVRFDAPPDDADDMAVAAITGMLTKRYDWAELIYVPGITYEMAEALVALPNVRGVELERIVVPTMTVANEALLVNASEEFGSGARDRWKVDGDGVVIAVLDTGIDQEHEVFDATRFVGGYDATFPVGGLSVGPVAPGPTPLNTRDPEDDSSRSHGTHVASLALANHREKTWIGAAPRAGFLDVKVLRPWPLLCPTDPCGTTSTEYGIGSMVIEGLDFVQRYNRGESHLGEPAAGQARVITMSLGETEADPDGSSVLSHAVNRVVDAGILVVASAGNCGPTGSSGCDARGNNTVPAPGAAKRALTVGAMDHAGTVAWSDDRIAGFSSRGPNGGEPKPNLVAYGVNITGARGDPAGNATGGDRYQQLSGTSMAAPFVAGVAALMFHGNASMDADAVKRILIETARDVGPVGWDEAHGSGVVNAYFAVGVAVDILDPRTTRLNPLGKEIPDVTIPEQTPPPEPETPNRTVANQPPRVAFIFGPKEPYAAEPVVFADRSHDREGDTLAAWNWDFGDGNSAKGDRVVHRYERPGTYLVRLTVTDERGAAGTERSEVTVLDVAVHESPAPLLPLLVLMAACAALLRRPGGRPLMASATAGNHPGEPDPAVSPRDQKRARLH